MFGALISLKSTSMTKHFTPSKKEAYVEQFYQSGLTQIAFCKHQGLVLKTFNKWLKYSKATPAPLSVDSKQATNYFQNGVATSKQAAFIPVHLDATCEPSLPQPAAPNCMNLPLKSFFHESALCLKTSRFSLDIPLDLATDYGQAALKSIIQILHQLPDPILSNEQGSR